MTSSQFPLHRWRNSRTEGYQKEVSPSNPHLQSGILGSRTQVGIPKPADKWATVEPVVITKSQFVMIAAYSRKSSGRSESATRWTSSWCDAPLWLYIISLISDGWASLWRHNKLPVKASFIFLNVCIGIFLPCFLGSLQLPRQLIPTVGLDFAEIISLHFFVSSADDLM